MLSAITGRVAWILDEPNYDIDLIVGVANIKEKDIEKLKAACMRSYDPDFAKAVKPGDVLIGGDNFGYGHPHYPSFRALRALGVAAVFAESYAPGFYRGETTNAFPLIECPGILEAGIARWDTVHFDWASEVLTVRPGKPDEKKLQCNRVPGKVKQIIEHGGILGYLKELRLKETQ